MKKINLVTLITKMIVACCILLAILFTMLISKYCIERNLILISIATILFLAFVCFVIFLFFCFDKFEEWYCYLHPTDATLALYICNVKRSIGIFVTYSIKEFCCSC